MQQVQSSCGVKETMTRRVSIKKWSALLALVLLGQASEVSARPRSSFRGPSNVDRNFSQFFGNFFDEPGFDPGFSTLSSQFFFDPRLGQSQNFFGNRAQQARFFNGSQFQFRGRSNPFLFNNSPFINQFQSVQARNGFEFFADAQEVPGFSKLRRRGNQTIGQLSSGAQVSLFVDRNGNLVDRFGNRVSDRDPDITRQFQAFAIQNRNQFQGGQRNAVDRFLAASGGFSDGRMTIDLAAISLDKLGQNEFDTSISDLPPGTNRVQAGLAALNFFLNTIQTRCLVRIFPQQVSGDGTVTLDFSTFRDANGNFCFNGTTLSLMKNSDEKDRCNNGKIRIGELINTMMQPKNYELAQGTKDLNRAQVSQLLGVSDNKLGTFGNKLLVGSSQDTGKKTSGVVGGTQRVLERQDTFNLPGRMCYRSLDFLDAHEGGAGAKARSVEDSGILFSHEAEEWLCIGANGFLVTFLFNQNGTALPEAPGTIASSKRLLAPAVRNVVSCLDCHNKGFIGGNPRDYKEEQKGRIRIGNQATVFTGPNGQNLTHGDFFTTNSQYNAVAQRDSNLFVEAQKRSGSYLPLPNGDPKPLIPSVMHANQLQAVTAQVMARELRVSESIAKTLLGSRKGMSRTEFENHFCEFKAKSSDVAKNIQEKARKAASSETHQSK